MLVQRVITAVVLLIVLAMTLASDNPWPFTALLALGAACACWEWLRLTVRQPPSGAVCVGVAVLAFVLMLGSAWMWLQDGGASWRDIVVQILTPIVALVWAFGATGAVVQGRSSAPPASAMWSLFSVPAIFTAWSLLALGFMQRGWWFVVSLLALVWIADIAAYFAGRAFGKRKLAPKVSPGKTIAGAVAGVLGAVVWVWGSSFWAGSFGESLFARLGLPLGLLAAALLGAISIVGDLFESLLKRRAGRKDSSNLLPGHGGVYDRIDAILPVAPFAFLLSGVLS
ncbi:phosphatidate cytidylyltransferase [Bordetella sp. 15P40C-2]|uniref:phosphatidate cytidylyltransferase n=1 Tax=Bordetella sp. 15P40C-2 TaxID=2572246 RepID=UPI00132A72AD|nr:phosphatidate cytidylyltransferase [Bordetella sp. 15P40C-2]MVW73136.1 phosphatidate cytidylyltransferase [Bordetella sp. 15P40C-2]